MFISMVSTDVEGLILISINSQQRYDNVSNEQLGTKFFLLILATEAIAQDDKDLHRFLPIQQSNKRLIPRQTEE